MRNERGFVLIELVVAMAIMALVAGAASMATFRIITDTERSNNHMTAVRQVQNTGNWISRDAMMAQDIDTDDDPGTTDVELVTFDWSDWESGDTHKVIYTFYDMGDGLKRLKRQQVIRDTDNVEIGNMVTLVAEYIVDSSSFSEQDGVLKLSVEARSGDEVESRDYRIIPRVNT